MVTQKDLALLSYVRFVQGLSQNKIIKGEHMVSTLSRSGCVDLPSKYPLLQQSTYTGNVYLMVTSKKGTCVSLGVKNTYIALGDQLSYMTNMTLKDYKGSVCLEND